MLRSIGRILVCVNLLVSCIYALTAPPALASPIDRINLHDPGDRPPGAKPEATKKGPTTPAPSASIVKYQEGRLILYTDLSPKEAQTTILEMKKTLLFAQRYWQHRVQGTLECYVAAHASEWPEGTFPHPLAQIWIDCIGGATISEQVPASCGERTKATMYASIRPGAVAHELVHAYCCQTFGNSGPDWYKEGFASMIGFGYRDSQGVRCPPEVLATLRQGPTQTVSQLFQNKSFTTATREALSTIEAKRENPHAQIPLSQWSTSDKKNLASMKRAYDWSWALCHLLMHDPNYQHRFRELGAVYLAGHRPDLRQTFGDVGQQLDFDYNAFLQHVDIGYRVDLCSWEWDKPFQKLALNDSQAQYIESARGYQASRVEVVCGDHYSYAANGTWSTSEKTDATDANGDAQGQGQLEGVILRDYQLSEPFQLGVEGTFVASTSGRLYIRCRDSWNQLADNKGTLRVAFTRISADQTMQRE